jgi:L-glutamine-phosphate cytidylyltransferase
MVVVFNRKFHIVVLAAGVGRRLRPLTIYNPKPMVLVQGRPIIERLLTSIPARQVKTLTIVVGYHGEVIKEYVDKLKLPYKVSYVISLNYNSTHCSSSLIKVKRLINKGVLVFNSDVLYSKNSINCFFNITHTDSFVVCKRLSNSPSDLQKVFIRNDFIEQWSLTMKDFHGEVIGPVYISPEQGDKMQKIINSNKEKIEKMPCFTFFSTCMISEGLKAVMIGESDAYEIDTVSDVRQFNKHKNFYKLT